jgi:DNA-binding NarL/FixJ family response regulator
MKVLLIDDHPLILSALQTVIQSLDAQVSMTGAGSARAARDVLAEQHDFDLVLLDLALGDADGFDVLSEFRAKYPALPVVVLSASDRASDVIRAVDQGAMGFVPKRASTDTLVEALRVVMSGGIYVPTMTLTPGGAPPAAPGPAAPIGSGGSSATSVAQVATQGGFQMTPALEALGITRRQRDVLALLLQGKPNKLIARELNLSVETVKDHVAAVLRALGVNTRTQAVLAVSQMTQQGGAPAATNWRTTQR